MDNIRRTLLKGAGSTGALAAAMAAGVLKPGQALATEWNKAAFESKDLASAMKGVGAATAADSKDLVLKAPEIAENGAVVPIDVTSNISNTTSISIFVDKNPQPLSAHFDFANGGVPEVSVRLKMGQTSMVKIVAKADGKFYSAQREVKVTAGGCGG
ncbi:MAG: thiosulfate oxidation carrier protein SoxY [Candidatus Nitricoxidivorans perseverans]|uniref:Thiosulfate oxidation carrier protein SoxY n=1 Tax=Candidatus Nitricoxidivorans perseverans TaxID=2975601 RepID=A0AA49FK85_9PROT|nr:MAG: thiosulfate oxidation carrier protein SoxY [Candidatus Nitricoxidivorans perseverans]